MKRLLNALMGRSMTVNFNALGVFLFILDMLAGTDIIKNNPDVAMLVTAVGNILLRFKTNKDLADK